MILPNLEENLGKNIFFIISQDHWFKVPTCQGDNDINMTQTQMPLCTILTILRIILEELLHRLAKFAERMANGYFYRDGNLSPGAL